MVDQGWRGRGEAGKLLVSCSFNCLDWTCGQASGKIDYQGISSKENSLPGNVHTCSTLMIVKTSILN